jgi:hypothetical protein
MDKDKSNVGVCAAVFTDVDTTTFSYSRRVKFTVAERNAFVADAIAERNAWQTRKTGEAGYVSNIEDRFVEVDI